MGKIDSIELANYVLLKGGRMSHIKLQKIVYYLEAYHLALFGTSLIDDEFEAWVHGPVSKKLWRAFSEYGVYTPIRFDSSQSAEIEARFEAETTEAQRDFVDRLIRGIKGKTGDQLEAMTHQEAPWKEARKGLYPGQPSSRRISKLMMRDYYGQKVNAVNSR